MADWGKSLLVEKMCGISGKRVVQKSSNEGWYFGSYGCVKNDFFGQFFWKIVEHGSPNGSFEGKDGGMRGKFVSRKDAHGQCGEIGAKISEWGLVVKELWTYW
jgi:hypothetical protein